MAQPAAAAAVPPANRPVPVRWSQIRPSGLNPRKHFDEDDLAELTESIAIEGVLQNLVLRPTAAAEIFDLVAGERRWRGIGRLIDSGRATPDYELQAVIRDLDDRAVLRIAMAENVQRQRLTPIEEADGYARMVELGDTPATIAALMGVSVRLVTQRLALHHRLADPVRQALEDRRITIGAAQAFTVGEKDRQEQLLASVLAYPGRYGEAEIRRVLLEGAVPMSRAIFEAALYKGALRRDLFADIDDAFAEDREEFRRLQLAAAEQRRAELATVWSWAELQVGGQFASWEYDRDGTPADAGAIVHLRDDLRVETYAGLRKRSRRTAATPAGRAEDRAVNPAAGPSGAGTPERPGPGPTPIRGFSRAHLVWARQEKTRRLQLAVAEHREVMLSALIVGLIGSQEIRIRTGAPWAVAPHDAVENKPLRAELDRMLARLSGAGHSSTPAEAELFRRVLTLPSEDRDRLLALLVAPQVGTWPGEHPELGDLPLAIAIARAAGIEPPGDGERFALTTEYLERLSKDQLLRVARAAGVGELHDGMKRGEMIDALALSDSLDPAWFPPELHFARRAEIEAMLAGQTGGNSRGGG